MGNTTAEITGIAARGDVGERWRLSREETGMTYSNTTRSGPGLVDPSKREPLAMMGNS